MICVFNYFTGMRKGEILTILWDQVDRHECIIRLESTKKSASHAKSTTQKTKTSAKWSISSGKKSWEIEAETHTPVEHLFLRETAIRDMAPLLATRSRASAAPSIQPSKKQAVRNYFYIRTRRAKGSEAHFP